MLIRVSTEIGIYRSEYRGPDLADKQKRKEAVLKETNMGLLKRVIGNDADKEVRDSVRTRLKTLRGMVDAYWKKLHAEALAAGEPGVVSIENHLAVVPTGDIVDKAIAENIMASLEAKAAANADDVSVVVRDGEVTLTGSVPNWRARRSADEAACYSAGVTHVNNQLAIMCI